MSIYLLISSTLCNLHLVICIDTSNWFWYWYISTLVSILNISKKGNIHLHILVMVGTG